MYNDDRFYNYEQQKPVPLKKIIKFAVMSRQHKLSCRVIKPEYLMFVFSVTALCAVKWILRSRKKNTLKKMNLRFETVHHSISL
jgi:hypothetical protein